MKEWMDGMDRDLQATYRPSVWWETCVIPLDVRHSKILLTSPHLTSRCLSVVFGGEMNSECGECHFISCEVCECTLLWCFYCV